MIAGWQGGRTGNNIDRQIFFPDFIQYFLQEFRNLVVVAKAIGKPEDALGMFEFP
jgi:hypothetical protein